jgi:predicted MFS family arabinose efflux permease
MLVIEPMRGNIPRVYAFRFLRDFLLIMPAIVPVYRSCGLDATQILLVQAIFSAAGLSFEVPSGYLADVLGRRRALLIGAVGMAAGMAAYGLANSFWLFAGAEVVLAFGYSLFSGTESALIFDTLKADNRETEYTRIEGKAEAWTRVGSAIAAVAGGLLAAVWLRLPFFANAGTAAVMLVIAFTLVEPPRPTLTSRSSIRQILHISRESLADPRLLPVMVFSAGILAVGVIGIWGYFLRLTNHGITVASYGIYFAVFQCVSGAAAAGSSKLARVFGPRGSYALLAVIPAVLLAFACTAAPWPVLLTPLAAATWGFSAPLLLNVLNRHITSDRRATVLSVSAMLGRMLFVVVAPIFGLLTDHVSGQAAFGFLAGAFAVLAGAAWWLKNRMRAMPATGRPC